MPSLQRTKGRKEEEEDSKHNVKALTTRPKERICNPRVCIKSVNVRPSTGESSSEPKSATYRSQNMNSETQGLQQWIWKHESSFVKIEITSFGKATSS